MANNEFTPYYYLRLNNARTQGRYHYGYLECLPRIDENGVKRYNGEFYMIAQKCGKDFQDIISGEIVKKVILWKKQLQKMITKQFLISHIGGQTKYVLIKQ